MTMLANSEATVPIGRKFLTHLGGCINSWLASWIARREREAARGALAGFNDRQRRDIGLAPRDIE